MIRLSLSALALVAVSAVSSIPASAEETCSNPQTALGVSRIVEIDAKTGPLFGGFTKYEKEPRFLGPKEVVLTFDDGPMPKYTNPFSMRSTSSAPRRHSSTSGKWRRPTPIWSRK